MPPVIPSFVSSCARPAVRSSCHVKCACATSPIAKTRPNVHQIPSRSLASVRSDREVLSDAWFTPSGPIRQMAEKGNGAMEPPPPRDDRKIKLGKSESAQFVIFL